jgi:hypothetical protein
MTVDAAPAPFTVTAFEIATFSAYVPAATSTVSPGTACESAYPIVRHGLEAGWQLPTSDPLGATKRVVPLARAAPVWEAAATISVATPIFTRRPTGTRPRIRYDLPVDEATAT